MIFSKFVTIQSLNMSILLLFQISFISDLTRALKYLHSTLGVHGNLRSTNCYVDSRFVVRLSGFGPKCLYGPHISDPPNASRVSKPDYRNEDRANAFNRLTVVVDA